jgi:ribulose-phosphate 3-epimerase
MTENVKIAPSILSADFGRLAEQVAEAEAAGADYIHVDVMDGHFVPNLTIGPVVVQAVRRATALPLDIHLMIEAPERYLAEFCRAGADLVTVQVETCPHLHRTVQQIKELGCKAGVALNPATPASSLEEILPYLDLVLVMTVNPGFGGQAFIESMTLKIARVRQMLDASHSPAELEVDGGIHAGTAAQVVKAGAQVLVAGSAVFGAPDGVARAMARLRESLPVQDHKKGQP